jgi:hypothetical protein
VTARFRFGVDGIYFGRENSSEAPGVWRRLYTSHKAAPESGGQVCRRSRRRVIIRAASFDAPQPGGSLKPNMRGSNLILKLSAAALAACVLTCAAVAQKKPKGREQPTSGAISGRVRVEAGATPAGITVEVRQDDARVAETTTDAKGDFQVQGLAPGSYGLTLRKVGLQVGRTDGIEVRAGKTVSLKDRLYLPLDEGALALVRGSVFDAAGRSFAGARVELARVEPDGSLKKLDSRVANVAGSFGFKLPPARARYRLTARAEGMEATTQDVDVDGAAIYRAALTLKPAAK